MGWKPTLDQRSLTPPGVWLGRIGIVNFGTKATILITTTEFIYVSENWISQKCFFHHQGRGVRYLYDSIQCWNFAKKWFIQYSIQCCFTQDSRPLIHKLCKKEWCTGLNFPDCNIRWSPVESKFVSAILFRFEVMRTNSWESESDWWTKQQALDCQLKHNNGQLRSWSIWQREFPFYNFVCG